MSAALLQLAWAVGSAVPAFLWKGICVHAIAAVLLPLMRPQDTRARYAVLCSALFVCVWIFAADVVAEYRSLAAAAGFTLDAAARGTPHAYQQLSSSGELWPVWIALGWLVGAMVIALRVWIGMVWLRHLVRASQPWMDAAWQERVSRMASRLRLPRTVGLRIVHGLSTPVTAGWLKPVLLVPANVITGMPADLLEALLAHELAHVRRLDFLINLLQHAAEALLFFHPSVWWLSRRIRIERERIADEIASTLIGNPRKLAQALGALSRYACADDARGHVTQGATDGELLDRIQRLLRPGTAPARRAMVVPLMAATLAVAGTAGWCALDRDWMHAAAGPEGKRAALADFPSIDALIRASGAEHVLVVDTHSGDKLAGRAEHDVVPIASLTKLMTAMVVLDASPDLNRPIRIDQDDAEATKASVSQLRVGTVVPLDTLLTLALMSSDNRAAYALARSYPGGASAFAQALQHKMTVLGLRHTTLEEPTGLSAANRSTASDIERIVRAAANYPEIARDTVQVTQTVGVDGDAIHYRNTNPLVGRKGWDILLSKTATSAGSGPCLVMRVQVRERDLILVLLNARQQPA